MSYLYVFYAVDESRCVLEPVEGHEHDYINANFIDVRICSSVPF